MSECSSWGHKSLNDSTIQHPEVWPSAHITQGQGQLTDGLSELFSLLLIHLFFPCSCSCQKPVPLSTKTPGLRAPQLIAGYTEFWFGDQACKELLGMPSPLCVQHYFTTTCTSITGVGKTLGLFNGFSSVLEQSAPLLWDSAVSVQLCCLGIQTPESTNPALLTPPLWKMSASGWHNYINVVIILEGL